MKKEDKQDIAGIDALTYEGGSSKAPENKEERELRFPPEAIPIGDPFYGVEECFGFYY